ncbi:MAG: MarR family transcriptional regulator [Candidatus Aenigmarchaeota archaeon]|nr:MarR family transcriptional regulator [Candidatus Aenigmarchaeota archaeon]
MKLFATVSFFLVFIFLTANVLAQVQFYGAEIVLDERGRSDVKLTITFVKPESSFSFDVIGKVENFTASSISGPIDCSVKAGLVSAISCSFNLTQEKRTIEFNFKTNDFVKAQDNKYFLDAELGIGKDIASTFVSVKLPEGMALHSENFTESKISFPENATTVTGGRSIIVFWRLDDVKSTQSLRFQVLYEKIAATPTVRLSYIIALGLVIASVLGFVIVKLRKPEKLVLSVLDDFERKVMDILIASGGVVNQKKIVRETNLSKAKVSRVVKSLVNRGLIEVERIGRTNKLKLKKKFSF